MEIKNQVTVHQKPPELSLQSIEQWQTRMVAEIQGFDDTDIKTLRCLLTGKPLRDRIREIRGDVNAMLIRMGVIMGVHIPDGKVFEWLLTEIVNVIASEKKYAAMTYEEYIQAFNMTANGDFGDIKDWGKPCNIKYFREVVNAYLLYKGSMMNKYHDWEMIAIEKLKIEHENTGKHKIDYRPITERCFQEFITGQYNPYLWHLQCYDDLVDVGWVPAEAWKDFENRAKQLLIGELNKEIMWREGRINGQEMYQKSFRNKYSRLDDLPKQLGAHMQSVSALTMIHNGQSAEPIQARAKQLCMVEYFKQQAIKGTKNLFIPANG